MRMRDWSSDVCSSDLDLLATEPLRSTRICDAASRGLQRVRQGHWFFDTPTSGKHPSSVPQEGTEVGGEAVRVLELKAVAGVRIQCEPAFGNRMGEHDRIDCWEGGVAVTICNQMWRDWKRTRQN